MLAIRHSTLVGALCLSLISHTLAADLALQGPAVIPEFLGKHPPQQPQPQARAYYG